MSLTLDDAIKAVAYYEDEEAAPGAKRSPLHVDLTATVAQRCVQRLTHDVTLSWKITGGRPLVRIEAHLTYPDRHVLVAAWCQGGSDPSSAQVTEQNQACGARSGDDVRAAVSCLEK